MVVLILTVALIWLCREVDLTGAIRDKIHPKKNN